MENKFNHKEEKLKQLADEFQIEVDIDQLWADVGPQLPPQRKRRYMWLFFLGLLLFLGGFATSKILTSTSINNDNTASESVTKSTASKIDNKILESNDSSYNTQPNNSTKINNTSGTPINNNSDISNLKNEMEKSTVKLADPNISTTQTNTPSFPINNGIINSKTSFSAPFITPITYSRNESQTNKELNKIELEDNIEKENAAPGITIDRPILLFNPILAKTFTIDREEKNTVFPQITPINSGNWYSYLSLSSGIFGTTRNMNPLPENGESLLQQNETVLPGIFTSIDYGIQNRGGWQIAAGLTHRMSTYRYTDDFQSISQQIINGGGSIKIEDDGSITDLGGDLLETTITNNNVRWHRTHQYVDLRLSLCKNLFTLNSIKLDANVNAAYNIWSHHKGYYINDANEFSAFSGNEFNPYANSGLMTGGQISLRYDLGRMQIGISPFAMLSHSYNTNQNYLYKTKNSYYGIQLNALYKL